METDPKDTEIVLKSFLMIVKQNDSYFLGARADLPGYPKVAGPPSDNQPSHVPIVHVKCGTI